MQLEFVEQLAGKASAYTVAQQRAEMHYSDVATAVAQESTLDWLGDIVPRKQQAAELAAAMNGSSR